MSALTYVIGFVLLGAYLAPQGFLDGEDDPAAALEFLLDHQAVLYAWHAVLYLLGAASLALLVMALRARLRPVEPVAAALSGALGTIWSGLLFAAGMVALVGQQAVVHLHGTDPAQATSAWTTVRIVQDALGGGIELVGGLWILAVAWAGLRSGRLPAGPAAWARGGRRRRPHGHPRLRPGGGRVRARHHRLVRLDRCRAASLVSPSAGRHHLGWAAVEAVIEVRDVVKRWGSTLALGGASCTVGPGVTGLLGANGAGKTSLLGLILGLDRPDAGQLRVFGIDPATAGPDVRALLGYSPEHHLLPPDVKAVDFVRHVAEVHGLPRREATNRASDVLWQVGLGEERGRALGTMSTGQRQRVKLAQALAHDPSSSCSTSPPTGSTPCSATPCSS
ncbi:MAG: ATP-binding cassette domain-containing protein [Acidimicrobiales bacterium]